MIDYSKVLSHTVVNTPKSGIRKFFDLMETMDDVVGLTVGQPDFVTPWHIREAGITSLEKGKTYYTSNAGTLELSNLLEALMAAGKIKVYEGVKDDGIPDRDVTDEYTIRLVGKPLTVKQRVLTVTAGSVERVFNGEEHTCNSYTLTGSLAAGDYIEYISFNGGQTAVGSSSNEVKTIIICNAAGEDVT